MVNDLISAICMALHTAFPSVSIFKEHVEQGIEEPSFMVRCVRPKQTLFRGQRYEQKNMFEVVYFPPMENRYQHTNAVLEQLFQILEVITVGDNSFRGTEMDVETQEDFTVVFTVNYNTFLIKIPEGEEESMNGFEERIDIS